MLVCYFTIVDLVEVCNIVAQRFKSGRVVRKLYCGLVRTFINCGCGKCNVVPQLGVKKCRVR